jgi:hypothetical protein
LHNLFMFFRTYFHDYSDNDHCGHLSAMPAFKD